MTIPICLLSPVSPGESVIPTLVLFSIHRWLFLVEGVVTVGVAIFSPFVLLDRPDTCHKFTHEERTLAVNRLKADGTDTGTNAENETRYEKGLLKALWATLTTPAFWIIYIGFMMVDGSFSIGYFYPTLVEGLGYDSITAQFMTAPLYVVVLPVAITLSYLADRMPYWRGLALSGTLLCGALFSAIAIGVQDFVACYVLMCLLNLAMYSAIPLALSFANVELAGVDPATRAIALAIMSGLGNLAQIYSSYLWPSTDAPQYLKGFAGYAGLLGLGAILYLSGWYLFRDMNLKARV